MARQSDLNVLSQLLAVLCSKGDLPSLPTHLTDQTQCLIRRHRLGPLAYTLGFTQFKTDYVQSAVSFEMRETIGQKIAEALARHNVPFCYLKGMAYARTLYADPAERPMGDMDILVRPRDFAMALSSLTSLDFVPRADKRTQWAPTHHAVTLDRKGISVDLHRSMTQPWRSRIDLDAIWQRVRPAPERGPGAHYLEVIDEIVMHATHIGRHELMTGLLSYIDLNRLLAQIPISKTDAILARASSYRVTRATKAVRQMAELLVTQRLGRTEAGLGARLLPNTHEILTGNPLPRKRQIAAKMVLVDGPKELIGLLSVALFERVPYWKSMIEIK